MMKVDNKFEIGELVKIKDSSSIKLRIQQIETATCNGGTQIFYAGLIVFKPNDYQKDK